MNRSVTWRRFTKRLKRCSYIACWVAALFIAPVTHGAKSSKANRAAAAAEFFAEPVLRTFQIQVPDTAFAQLRSSPRSYVTGTIAEGGHVLTNVAIRLRGNGSFRSLDEKPSFAIKFDEFATDQNYRGLDKLMFNNSIQDETRFAEFLATQLFRDAGHAAARVTHARLKLNGRDLGLYVVIEAMNKDFLKQHFRNPHGNFYEAPFRDIDIPLEQDSGTRGDQADLKNLYRVCSMTNATERWRELPRVLDVDRFISFAAMEMLVTHWDGYVLHTNNYRLYHDPMSDKFVFIPHGMDWALLRPNLSLRAPQHSVVARAVLSIPEGQKLYRERVGALFTNIFRVAVITNRIEQELARIRTGNFNSNEFTDIERRAMLMRDRVIARAARASNELAGVTLVPLKFETNGIAPLTEWRADYDGGTGKVERVTFDGRAAFHITATGPNYHPSWRSLVYMEKGSYRFEGVLRIDAKGPVAAMLRLSGPSTATTYSSATGWRELAYDFQVRDELGHDVEFVCDFSATEGEAWFDVNSLRVRRLSP
jgi:spore coat protein H